MTRLRPLYLSAITFLVALAAGSALVMLAEHRRNDERRQTIADIGSSQAHMLERQFERSLSSTFALASVLRQSGRIDDFDTLAAEIIKNYGGISSLQLAPKGVVTQIYPLEGNQEAIGHDLLNDPRRRTEALKAVESRQLTLAGPFRLIQGGMAVIGRFPVFVPDEGGAERFWGFTIALIRLPALLEASDVKHLVDEHHYDYELSRIEPNSGARVVFARSANVDLQKPASFEIEVPNGSWTLAIAPLGGWPSSFSLLIEAALVFLASSLVAAFTYRILRQPAILRREVAERRRAELTLQETSQSLQAIIETSPLPIFAMDPEGKLTMWNPAAERVFGWREGEVLGHPLPFVPQDKKEEHRVLRERVMRGQILTDIEVRRQKKDGSSIDISFSTSLLRNPEGQVHGIMAVIIDITERKQAEEALRRAHDELELRVQERTDALHESREHFRKLVETTSAIPWEANAKTCCGEFSSLEFTYVGPQAVELLGYPVDQWYEKDFWVTHLHSEDRDHAIDFCRKSSSRAKDYEFEYRMVAADGRIVWVHDIVAVTSVNGVPETLRGFMMDITDRKRVDETLRSLVEGTALVTGDDFFRSLVCNLAAALRVRYAFVSEFIDGNTRVRTLAFWTSDRLVDNVEYPIAGTPCEQVLGGEMCHYPSGVQAVYPKDENLVKLGAESYLGIPLFDRLGDVVGNLAVIDDKPMPAEIRDLAVLKIFAARAGGELVRKQVEEALRESEEGTRLVVDSALDAVIMIDPGGLITGWNPQAETIFGWSREEAIGQQLAETIIPPQYREAHRRGLQHFLATGEGPILNERIEITALRRDGHEFPVELTVSPIQSGKTFNFSAFARDISQRKQAEETLQQSEAALRNSQKDLRILAGKLLSAQEEERRRLARELHDDLTQRLAVLAIEAASLGKVLSSSPSPVRDRVRRMKEQMVKLSADVHGISRQLHPSILDDLGLVSAIESECAAFSERDGVRVTFTPENVPEALPKDVSLCLYRVTQEGLRNIAKHAQAKEAYVTLACLDGGVLLTVQDRGVGFDLAQAKGKMGLGLDSMEERVRLLQGSFSIHSKPGQGTIIRVHAPLVGTGV